MMILDKLIQDRLNGKGAHKVIFPASKNGVARAQHKGRMEISITPLLAAALAACTGDNIRRPMQPDGTGGGPGPGGGPDPGPTDQAPTALTITPQSGSVDEGTSTEQKLADITFTDDALGTNTITVPTGSIFEIRSVTRTTYELWLRPNVNLDFEAQNRYTVTLTPTVTGAGNAPNPLTFILNVNNVREPVAQAAYFGQEFNVQLPTTQPDQTFEVVSVADDQGRPVAMDDTGWLRIDAAAGTLSGTPRANYEVPARRFSFVESTRQDAQGNEMLFLTPVFQGEEGYEPTAGKQVFVDTGRTKTITLENGESLTYSILEATGPGDTGYVAPMETVSDDSRFFLVTVRRSDGEVFSYYIPVGEAPVDPVFEGGRDANDMALPITLSMLENTAPTSLAVVEGRFSPAGDSATYTVTGATPLPTSAPDSLTTYTISGGVADTSQTGFTHRVDGMHGRLFFNMDTGAYRYVPTATAAEINALLAANTVETFTVTRRNADDTDTQVTVEIALALPSDDPTYLGDLTDYVTNFDEVGRLEFAFAASVPQAIQDLFAIEGSHLRYVGAGEDYEAAGGTRSWTFDIVVTDMDSPEGARRQDTASVTVNLEDIPGTREARNILSHIVARDIIDTPTTDDFADIVGSFSTLAGAGTSTTYTVSQVGGMATASLVDQTLQRWQSGLWTVAGSGPAAIDVEGGITDIFTVPSRTMPGEVDIVTYFLRLTEERDGQTEIRVDLTNKPAVADTSQSGYTHRVDGKYGALFFNQGTGAYRYVPNDAAINGLNAGQTDTEEFVVTVNDGNGNSLPRILTINIRGADDSLRFDSDPALVGPPPAPPTLADYQAIINTLTRIETATATARRTELVTQFRDDFLVPKDHRDGTPLPTLPARETSVTITDGSGGSRTAPVGAWKVEDHMGAFARLTSQGLVSGSLVGVYTLDENADGSGTAINIGLPVSATDADGNAITYSLRGADGNAPTDFEITSTGQIRYTGSGINYEVTPRIELTVIATSTNGRIEKHITVLIRNIGEDFYLHPITPHTITDTSAVDDFDDIEGAFVTDHDGAPNIEYKIGGQVADTSQAGYTHRVDGRYGQLFFNADTGAYKYMPNNNVINGLNGGLQDSDNFEVTVEKSGVAGLDILTREDRTDLFISEPQLLIFNIVGGDDTLDFTQLQRVVILPNGFSVNRLFEDFARITVTTGDGTATRLLPVHELPATFTIPEGQDFSGGRSVGRILANADSGTLTYSLEGAPSGWMISNLGSISYRGPALQYDTFINQEGDAFIEGTTEIRFTVVAQVGSTRIEKPIVVEVINVPDHRIELTPPNQGEPYTVTDTEAYDDFPDQAGRFTSNRFEDADTVLVYVVTHSDGTAAVETPAPSRPTAENPFEAVIVGTRRAPDGQMENIYSTHKVEGDYGTFYYHNLLRYNIYVRDDEAANALPAGTNGDDVFNVVAVHYGADGVAGNADDVTTPAIEYRFRVVGGTDGFLFTVPTNLEIIEGQAGTTTPLLVGSPVAARAVDMVENPVTNAFYMSSFYAVTITADTAGPAGNNIQVRLVYDSARAGADASNNNAVGAVEVRGAGTGADPYIITVYTTFSGISVASLKSALDGHTTAGTGDTAAAADLIDITVQTRFVPIDVSGASGNTITFQLSGVTGVIQSYELQDADGNAPTDFTIDDMGQIRYTGTAFDYDTLTEEQRTITLTVIGNIAGGDDTVEQDVTISIVEFSAFVFTVPPRLEILEGQAGTAHPIPVGDPITARDPAISGLSALATSYSLRDADGNAPTDFEIDDMGHIRYTGAAFDYSALAEADRTITLTVIAEKDGRTEEQDVPISTTTHPTLTHPGGDANQLFIRDTTNMVDTSFNDVTGQFTGSDAEGDPLRFIVERQVVDTSKTVSTGVQSTHRVDDLYGTFYFNEGTGHFAYVLRDAATLEGIESSHSYDADFLVRASDGFYQTNLQRLRISLEGRADVFGITTNPSDAYTITENADGSTTPIFVGFIDARTRVSSVSSRDGITYELEGAPDDFTITRQSDGRGRIEYTGPALDFETSEPIIFTVIVSHADYADIKRIVVVEVTDVAENAVLDLTARQIVDTSPIDGLDDLTGQFMMRGADHDGVTGYTITGEVELDANNHVDARNLREGFTHKAVGTYGTLYFNAISGHYKYAPDDVAVHAVGNAGATESFEVKTFTSANAYSGSGENIINTITRSVANNAQNFNINIIGADEVFSLWSGLDSLTLVENMQGDTTNPLAIGTVTRVDPTGTLSVTYSLEDVPRQISALTVMRTGNPIFSINSATGEISFIRGVGFDHETTPTVAFTVVATVEGVAYRTPVTVTITNVVEAPAIQRSSIYHSAIEGSSLVLTSRELYTVQGDSRSPDELTYTLTDNSDAGNFEILGDHDDNPATPDTWQAVSGTSSSSATVTFTQADVNEGRVRYTPTDASANTDASFSFTVSGPRGGEVTDTLNVESGTIADARTRTGVTLPATEGVATTLTLTVGTGPSYTDTAADNPFAPGTGTFTATGGAHSVRFNAVGQVRDAITETGYRYRVEGKYGTLFINDGSAGTVSGIVAGGYRYIPNDEAINGLGAGTHTDEFQIKAVDHLAAVLSSDSISVAVSAVQTFTVTITGADDPTTVTVPSDLSLPERATDVVIGTVTATDRDLTTAYSLVNAPTGFTINSEGTILYTGTKAAYDALTEEQRSLFTVTLGGERETVRVTPPILMGDASASAPIVLGSTTIGPQPDITYSLVTPPAGFTIDQQGNIRYTGTAYDYETLTAEQRTITFMVDVNGVQETVTIAITDVSDNVPVVEQNTIIYDQTQNFVVLTNAHLLTSDADTADGPEQLTYTISDSSGRLEILDDHDDDANTADTWEAAESYSFTQADINAGRVRYVPSDTDNSAFTFTVADSGGDMLEGQTLNVEKAYKVVEDSMLFNTDDGQIAGPIIYIRQSATSPNIVIGADNTNIGGLYGTLTANTDGTWSYALNNDNILVDMLNGGGTLTESFQYFAGEIETVGGYPRAIYRTFTITIEGRTDASVTGTAHYDERTSTDDLVVRVTSPEGPQDIRTGAGDDIIFVGATSGGKRVYGGAGNDEIRSTSVGLDGVLRGEDGDDYIFGGTDDETIHGGNGDDYIEGGDGVDGINGGDGNDEIHGGAGNDIIRGSDLNDNIDGNDLIYGDAGNDEIHGGRGDDTIYGGADSDTINGDTGNDILYGERGGDTLNGGADNDMLYGMAGADSLSGGAGDDTLMGGNGVDTFSGGLGTDILIGGDGNDRFTLAVTNTQDSDYDIVTDFTSGDVIRADSPFTAATTDTLAEVMSDIDIRWTQDSNHATGTNTNDANTNDTIIYATQGTDSDTTDDVILMVLEDYTTALTISDFEVY